MRISFAHICDYASVSREGKLSINGIFSNIASQAFPSAHPLLYVVFEVDLSAAELNQELTTKVKLQGADGAEIFAASMRFKVGGMARPGERPKIPQVLPIAGLVLPAPGMYQFSIWINGSHKVDVPFSATTIDDKGTSVA